ncbi:MAG: dihydroxy-acid dehydratase [Pseudomonadota bacterium]
MMRLIVGLVGALVLTGCTAFAPATRSVALVGGDVMVDAPAGYCVDTSTSRPGDGFAVLAPCASLGAEDPAPGVVAVATLQVGPPDSGSIAGSEIAFRDFLITDAGTALLSRNSDAEEISILSTQAFNSRVMIHFADTGPPPLAGLQQEEWRAFTDVGGRLVTIGLRGLAVAPLDDGPGAGLLKDVLAGVAAPAVAEPVPAVARAGG